MSHLLLSLSEYNSCYCSKATLQAHASWATFQSDVITWDILLATVGALSKQLALPFLACVSFWKSGASFSYHPQDHLSGFAFPSQNKKYFWRIWSAVETTRIAGKREGLPASPRPDVRESSLYDPCFPHRNSCQEERLDKAGPPKVFTDWQPQMFIIYKLSL